MVKMIDGRQIVESQADISRCGNYRSSLLRRWHGSGQMVFIMLNPSTADAMTDDPTIRRCMGFARREGLGAIKVVNLFTRRTPSPAELVKADDPLGPDAQSALSHAFSWANNVRLAKERQERSDVIVAAWGAPPSAPPWWRKMHREQVEEVRALAQQHGHVLHHLGLTKDGHPRHPLYLPADAPLSNDWRATGFAKEATDG